MLKVYLLVVATLFSINSFGSGVECNYSCVSTLGIATTVEDVTSSGSFSRNYREDLVLLKGDVREFLIYGDLSADLATAIIELRREPDLESYNDEEIALEIFDM